MIFSEKQKFLGEVFAGSWPLFSDGAATPCFIGFSGNSPLRSPCYGLFARETISPVARSPPPARVLLCADPPPSRPPTHCALRHLSQYVTQRATIARRARALPLCTFPAITHYVTYRNMCRSGQPLPVARAPSPCAPSQPLRATSLIAICVVAGFHCGARAGRAPYRRSQQVATLPPLAPFHSTASPPAHCALRHLLRYVTYSAWGLRRLCGWNHHMCDNLVMIV